VRGRTDIAGTSAAGERKIEDFDDYLPLTTRWTIWDSRSLPVKRLAISASHDIDFVRKLIGV
jgi:hypothetical protein